MSSGQLRVNLRFKLLGGQMNERKVEQQSMKEQQ